MSETLLRIDVARSSVLADLVSLTKPRVISLLPPTLRAAHRLVGTLVWATLVVLMFHSARTPVEEPDATVPR